MDGHLARLQLGDIQHILHQPRQSARLLRDNAKVVLCLLGRDGAVQHTINKALDGGHRGAQLVGNVTHKLPAGVVNGLQPRRHIVKGGGKICQFHTAVHRGAGRKVPAAQPPGCLTDILNGAGDAPGQHPAQDAAQNQNHHSRNAEHGQHIPHIAAQCCHRAGGKQVAFLPAHGDAPPGRIVFGAVDAVQRAGDEDIALVHPVYVRKGDIFAGEGIIPRVQQNLAVFIGDKDQRAGRRVEQLVPAVGAFQNIVPLQGLCDDGALVGKTLAQGCRTVEDIGQRASALTDEVRRGQRRLDRAHHAEPQHQHGGNRGKKFAAYRVAAVHSLTSNL